MGGLSLNADRTRLGAGRFHGVGGAKVGGASVHSWPFPILKVGGGGLVGLRPGERARHVSVGGPGWVARPLREAAPLSDPGAGSAVGRNRGSWSRGLLRGL